MASSPTISTAAVPYLVDHRYAAAVGVDVEHWRGRFRVATVGELWIETSVDQNWTSAFRVVMQSGAPVIGEVRIFPTEGHVRRPPGGWSAQLLGSDAAAPLGGVKVRTLRRVSLQRAFVGAVIDHLRSKFGYTAAAAKRAITWRVGRPALQPIELARAAAAYVEALHTDRPVPTAARRLGLEPSVLRNRLTKARRAGLLTKARKANTAGGRLTPAAKRLLDSTVRRRR
jgi:hypothetical protein